MGEGLSRPLLAAGSSLVARSAPAPAPHPPSMMQKRYGDFLRNFRADSVFKQKAVSAFSNLR